MAGRHTLLAIVGLSAALHFVGIAQSLLPAQDGLKFIRIARGFQSQPWADVIRGADQHPLYPALVALTEPVVRCVIGRGPQAWRIAAQTVSALASLAIVVPLFGLTRRLFDQRIATLAALIYVLLPIPNTIGHDTLSDSLGLLAVLTALWLGESALRTQRWAPALGSGIAAGIGFLARPEVVVAPAAIVLTGLLELRAAASWKPALPRLATLGLSFLVLVGTYALVKGEVSEKLALRIGASLAKPAAKPKKAPQWLPPGLDDPRWDFSPKEETDDLPDRSARAIVKRLFIDWTEGLAWVFAVFAGWGAVRGRFIRRRLAGDEHDAEAAAAFARRLIASDLALFTAVLIRHASRMGYLSGRHTLTLVLLSIPWAAAGALICARRLAEVLHWSRTISRGLGAIVLVLLIGTAVFFQLKPAHPSRWGHWAAGRWLIANTKPADAVLDTRGWAAFVSGRPSYDYWHVRQAFTDAKLAYVVVGADELNAESRRAQTLRAVLAYAATPVASFPERSGGNDAGVRIYRFHRPASWEALRP